MKRRTKALVAGGLVMVLAGAGLGSHFAGGAESAGPRPRLVAVGPGTVVATVSATGNVAPSLQVALDFPEPGRLVELDVTPGDRVTAGQVLARVDDRAARDEVARTTAALAAATAHLAADEAGLTPAERAVARAAEAQAAADADGADAAVANALAVADTDGTTLDDAVAQADTSLAQARATAALDGAALQGSLDRAAARLAQDTAAAAPADQLQTDRDAVRDATDARAASGLKDAQAVEQAQQQAVSARDARAAGKARDSQAAGEARRASTSARAGLGALVASDAAKAAVPPATLAADRAAVAEATAAMHESQRALDATALVAPADAQVTVVTKKPGELVGAAPPAAVPASDGSAAPAEGFIVLADTGSLVVRGSFSEADASRVRVGQPATVSFDALAGRSLRGSVAAVAPTPTVVNNVVTYPVTVRAAGLDGVLPGMTANIAVEVERAEQRAVIPNTAIASVGTVSEVVVVAGGHQAYRQVRLGDQGDTVSAVLGGLRPGERIIADKPVAHEADGDVIPPPVPAGPIGTGP